MNELQNAGRCTYSAPIGSFTRGFNPRPQELSDEGVTNCLKVAVDECSLNHNIDLNEWGFTQRFMEMHPPIHISEWFAVRHNSIALYHIDVKLLNANWDSEYRVGRFRNKSEHKLWSGIM